MRALTFFLLVLITTAAHAADYAREQAWEDEILDSLVVGDAVYLEAAGHRFLGLYTEASSARGAVVLVHGIGVHPDWGLIGVLRRRLADVGYTTLSIQMPVLARDAATDGYATTFDEAAARLHSAVHYCQARGHASIAIVSHSMGARMTNHYLTGTPDPAVTAWVSLGIPGAFTRRTKLHVPTADIFGEMDLPAVLSTRAQRKGALAHIPGARQVVIAGADHFYTGHDDALLDAVRAFLDFYFPRRE
jgi:alpha/beta superfamily hydrolase